MTSPRVLLDRRSCWAVHDRSPKRTDRKMRGRCWYRLMSANSQRPRCLTQHLSLVLASCSRSRRQPRSPVCLCYLRKSMDRMDRRKSRCRRRRRPGRRDRTRSRTRLVVPPRVAVGSLARSRADKRYAISAAVAASRCPIMDTTMINRYTTRMAARLAEVCLLYVCHHV